MSEVALPSWIDTATRSSIVEFVESVDVPPEERIAVFDNDGTLWSEKPMPVELGFILERLAEMAEKDESLRGRQPWKAAYERDHGWLGGAINKHYAGDDGDLKLLLAGVLGAFAGWTVEEYAAAAAAYLERTPHPAFLPMVELLRYLEANGFTNYIASGGDRDFMRSVAQELYGIPPERIVGSSNALAYNDGELVYQSEPDVFDDGPVKPVRIWSRIGRRPLVAAGNSNGDIPMLSFAGGASRPALRLLVLHDDAEREFDYTTGAEQSLERAKADGWTVISVKHDWKTVFADASG